MRFGFVMVAGQHLTKTITTTRSIYNMAAYGWSTTPLLVPDSASSLTIVAANRPRDITLTDSTGTDLTSNLGRPRLEKSDLSVGLLSTPRINDWGTIFAIVKAPSLGNGPVPVAQRCGATLWFSHGHEPSADGHAVEWVEPGEWYLIASHVTTERVWWDIVGWGSGWGSTIEAEVRVGIKDNGLTLIAFGEPLTVASLEFHDRTFGHDEVMSLADSKTIGFAPTIKWNLNNETSETNKDVLTVLGSCQPALSWDATSTRSKKRAVSIMPTRGFSWRAETKVPIGSTNVLLGRSGDGFVLSAASPKVVPSETVVSLMNTPYPQDDE
jgi:hypothetical protein